jgi:hypothetical protein
MHWSRENNSPGYTPSACLSKRYACLGSVHTFTCPSRLGLQNTHMLVMRNTGLHRPGNVGWSTSVRKVGGGSTTRGASFHSLGIAAYKGAVLINKTYGCIALSGLVTS